MTAPALNQRTQVLVDRRYQLRFVTRVFLSVMGVAVASCLVASAIVWRVFDLPTKAAGVAATVALAAISATLLIELLLAIPLIFILGIRQTHRFVGPMERIMQVLEAVGRGDFGQRIALRRGDALEDLAEAVNRMAEQLEARGPASTK
jgi:methyl-accepting chemotaxis protein